MYRTQATVYYLIFSWIWCDRAKGGGEAVVLPKKIYSNLRGNNTITQNRFAVRCFAILERNFCKILEAKWMILVSSGIKSQLTCSYISVRQTSQMQQIFSLLHQVSKRKKRSHLQK